MKVYPLRLVLLLLISVATFSISFSQCIPYNSLSLPEQDTSKLNLFGRAMSLNGDVLVIGAPKHDSLEAAAGLVYVYQKGLDLNWHKIATLIPSKPIKFLGFGRHVSIKEDRIIVGAEHYYEEGFAQATLYVYEKEAGTNWQTKSESYQITTETPGDSYFFNFDVFENTLAVRHSERINFSILKHSVHLYEFQTDGFELVQQLEFPFKEFDAISGFGEHIALGDNFVAITAPNYSDANDQFGIAFVFEKSNNVWASNHSAELLPSDFENSTLQFGHGLEVVDSTVFVGISRPRESQPKTRIAAYVYEKPTTGWAHMTEINRLSPGIFNTFMDNPAPLRMVIKAHKDYVIVTNPAFTHEIIMFIKNGNHWDNTSGANGIRVTEEKDSREFGSDIAFNDSHLFISNVEQGGLGFGQDTVYQYIPNEGRGWQGVLQQGHAIVPSSINAGLDHYGGDISSLENTMVAGAEGDDTFGHNSGAVYINEFDGEKWVRKQKITGPEPQPFDSFGAAVEVSDSLLFVGAIGVDSLNDDGTKLISGIGKVYVYRRTEDSWVYSTSILAPDIKRQAHFGREITYHNGYVAIHEFASISSDDKGLVHLYHFQNSRWAHLATLTPSTPHNSDHFGRSISMNDSVIVVGTGGVETSSQDSTPVYVFLKDGEWKDATEDAILVSSDKHRSDLFGFDVDLSGNYVIVGAPWFSTTVTSSEKFLGKAYLFERPDSGWLGVINETAQLTPSDPKQDHFFGYSVTVDPHNIKVGAPHYILNWNRVSAENRTDINVEPGKVYVYFRPSTGWATTTEGIQLTSPEPEPLDVFGATIESGNGHFFVGSFLDDNEAGKQSGSVHTYDDLPYIINSSTIVCPEDDNIQLLAFPTGGEWVGKGVDSNTGIFDPSLAGSGTHIISYRIGTCLNLPSITIEVPETLQPIDIDATELYICQHQDSVEVNHNYSSITFPIHWSFSEDGVNFTDINSTNIAPNFYAKQAGLYRATVTNPCYTFSDVIQIYEQAIEVPPGFSICADEEIVTLQNYSPTDGLWLGTGITSDGTIDLTTLEKGPHYYHYEVSRINCVFKDSVLVDLHSIPAIAFSQDQTEYSICATDQVEISISEFDPTWKTEWEYSRDNARYFLLDDQELETLKAQNQGFYRAIVSDDFCEVVSDLVEIKHIGESHVSVPNVFTPNGDGINDTFRFEYENISVEALRIYNRLGKVVFESNDLLREWNGLNQPAGVYFYNLSYYATCDPVNKFESQGIIHILK